MTLTVDFITLGDASERLSTEDKRVPSATLRHWTEQLEEYNTHYVLRNNRNERIYYESDLEIFAYLRDLKEEYGRRTTTLDLANMLRDKAEAGEFKLRSREDAPIPVQSNRTADLLGQEDIKRLMDSDRVKQFIGIILAESHKAMEESNKMIREELIQTVREELLENKTHSQLILEELEAKRIKREEEREKREEERLARMEELARQREERSIKMITEWREQQNKTDKEFDNFIKQQLEQNKKGFFARLFGK